MDHLKRTLGLHTSADQSVNMLCLGALPTQWQNTTILFLCPLLTIVVCSVKCQISIILNFLNSTHNMINNTPTWFSAHIPNGWFHQLKVFSNFLTFIITFVPSTHFPRFHLCSFVLPYPAFEVATILLGPNNQTYIRKLPEEQKLNSRNQLTWGGPRMCTLRAPDFSFLKNI